MGDEFQLSFTQHVPDQFLPTYTKVASEYTQTVHGAPIDNIILSMKKRGVYVIRTQCEKDSKKLEGKYLTYHFGKNDQNQVKVKFEKLPKFQYYRNPIWITIDWTEESSFRLVENTEYDSLFKQYGTIIVQTHDDTYMKGMRNGRKKLRLDLNVEKIDRFQTIQLPIVILGREDEALTAYGKVKITYRGQPVFCKECSTDHVDRCPERVKREALEKEEEKLRENDITTLIIGDSNLRYTNKKALNADVISSMGAKIGHIANELTFIDKEKYDHIVVAVGQNNIDTDPEINEKNWKKHTNYQLTKLRDELDALAQNGRTITMLEIPEVEMTEYSEKTKKMKNYIDEMSRAICKTGNKDNRKDLYSTIVVTKNELVDIEATDDYRHITQLHQQVRLMKIDNTLENKLIRTGKELTVDKKYSEVTTHYRLGCDRCTMIGHSATNCSVEFNNKRVLSTDSAAEQSKPKKTNNSIKAIDSDIDKQSGVEAAEVSLDYEDPGGDSGGWSNFNKKYDDVDSAWLPPDIERYMQTLPCHPSQ